ncbi:MAG TPA: hypothetical protein VER03_12795 [Bryobacteraceae bacterium]|nr:hypothetical protein [Bryobacteraceae bacterium]
MRPADTGPEVWKVFIELQRQMAPGEKLRQVFDYSWMPFQMTQGALRAENPKMSEREVFLRAASRRLDAQTMITVYGWDPATERHVP